MELRGRRRCGTKRMKDMWNYGDETDVELIGRRRICGTKRAKEMWN